MEVLRTARPLLASLLLLGMPSGAMAQSDAAALAFSGDLGLGLAVPTGAASISFGGKAGLRAHLDSGAWAIGVRIMAAGGERRQTGGIFGSAAEQSTETAALLYRARRSSDDKSALYLGAGVGRLSSRRFMGSSSELEDVSGVGLAFEAALHAPARGLSFVFAAQGYAGGGGPLLLETVGVGFGG